MRRPPSLLVPASIAVCLLAACSSPGGSKNKAAEFSQPPTSAFAAGSCQSIAADVLTIGRDARRLGSEPTPPKDVLSSLTAAQTRVRAAQAGLGATLATPVDHLVVAVGVVRLSGVTGSYVASMGTSVSTAYQQVVDACTG